MPVYKINGPDGKTYKINGPEGATREQIVGALQARVGGVSSKAKKPQGVVSGAIDQFTQGVVGNFGDELTAHEAGILGKTPDGGWFDYSKSYNDRYDAALKAERSQQSEFQAKNPVTSVAAQIAGAVVPAAGVGKAVSATQKGGQLLKALNSGSRLAKTGKGLAAGSVIGAGTGAVYGFGGGEGGLENRISKAKDESLMGGALGGVAGAAAPHIAQGLQNVASRISGPIRQLRDRAGRRGAKALLRDLNLSDTSPIDLIFSKNKLGDEAAFGDLFTLGQDRLDEIGNSGYSAAQKVRDAMGARLEGRSDRVSNVFDSALGPAPDLKQSLDEIARVRKTQAAGNYGRAFYEADKVDVGPVVDDLDRLLNTDTPKVPGDFVKTIEMAQGLRPVPKPKDAGPKNPILEYLRAGQGVHPEGEFASELKHRGINPRSYPGLFKRNDVSHRATPDNIPATEYREMFGIDRFTDDGNGYISPDDVLEDITNLQTAPSRMSNEELAVQDMLEHLASRGINEKQSAQEIYKQLYPNELRFQPPPDETHKVAAWVRPQLVDDQGMANSSLENLHKVQQNISDKIAHAKRQGDIRTLRTMTDVRNKLLGQMDASSPLYNKARNVYRDDMEIQDAFEQGMHAFNPSTKADFLRHDASNMSEAAKDALKLGARGNIKEIVSRSKNGDMAALKFIDSDKNKDIMSTVYGDKASQLVSGLEREKALNETVQRVLGNSQTARRQQSIYGNQPNSGVIGELLNMNAGNALRSLSQKMRAGSIGREADEYADLLLTRGGSLDELIRLVSKASQKPRPVEARKMLTLPAGLAASQQ